MHCLKYGLTVHNVRRVRGVLITGEIVEFGGDALDSPGYDLLALINGSEGLLAVITEVTVKLTAEASGREMHTRRVRRSREGGEAVAAIIGAGIIPAGLEMMDRLTIGAVEPFVNAGYPLDAEAILLCEVRRHAGGSRGRDRTRCARCWSRAAPRASRSRKAKRSACGSGRGARPHFPRRVASRPTITASTARFRAARWRPC